MNIWVIFVILSIISFLKNIVSAFRLIDERKYIFKPNDNIIKKVFIGILAFINLNKFEILVILFSYLFSSVNFFVELPSQPIDPFFCVIMDIINNIAAPLIVGVITFFAGLLWNEMRTRKKIDAAPKKYIQALDNLITKAVEEGEQKAVINARAIVSTRNTLRDSLVSISKNLNSEIDLLAINIGHRSANGVSPSSIPDDNRPNAAAAWETILVLHRMWPSKKEQIEVEIRKLIAEMGLTDL